MKSVMMAEAKAKLSALVDEVRSTETAIQICKRRKPAAYLIRAGEYERLRGMADSVRALEIREALAGRRFELRKVIADLELAM